MLFDITAEGLTHIGRSADDHFTFVRLAKIETGVRAVHDHIDQRFHGFRHERRQVHRAQWQFQTGGFCERGRMARNGNGDLWCTHQAPVGLHPFDPAIGPAHEMFRRCLLMDLNAHRIDCACVSPSHRVVPVHTCIGVHHAADHGQTRVRASASQRRNAPPNLVRADLLIGGPVDVHGQLPATQLSHLGVGLNHIDHGAFGVHHVEVQLSGQTLVEFDGLHIKRDRSVAHIVRPDRDRIACDVAAAQPATLQYGDIGDPVFFGEVVGRCQAVPTCADNNDIVTVFERRGTPGAFPSGVFIETVAEQGAKGIALHHVHIFY